MSSFKPFGVGLPSMGIIPYGFIDFPNILNTDETPGERSELLMTAQDFKLAHLNLMSFPVRAYDSNGFAYKRYGPVPEHVFVLDSLATMEGELHDRR